MSRVPSYRGCDTSSRATGANSRYVPISAVPILSAPLMYQLFSISNDRGQRSPLISVVRYCTRVHSATVPLIVNILLQPRHHVHTLCSVSTYYSL
ncbi:hypothetical protein J6590_020315 [Homalodisca vitripennis]|nr:hypothetical protein J6590_020315 [Homalodisca vitripennis]